VHGENVYEVTDLAVLVHNLNEAQCAKYLTLFMKAWKNGKGFSNLTKEELAEFTTLLKAVKSFDYGSYLKGILGPASAKMIGPHAHHILFKGGLGPEQKKLVAEGMEILVDVGIDPIKGIENLVWAPLNAKGQHGIEALEHVMERIKAVYDGGKGGYKQVAEELEKLGLEAAKR
jgi:hypothetical protein